MSAGISFISFLYYYRHGDILLYGDAVAHINIARRVVDSLTPGLLQLGTVWLPLPHLITIPFVMWDSSWQSGVGGSIGSMIAFVLGGMGAFRLVSRIASKASAWLAAGVYLCNPNLIYLQSTAMTEPLYMATMIWAAAYFIEFVQARDQLHGQSAGKALVKCGLVLSASMFTRYDGWVLSACAGSVAFIYWMRSEAATRRELTRFTLIFITILLIPPLTWFGYNWKVFHNPLEFANGPYSAHAIAERSMRSGDSPYPGHHSPMTAWVYFIKCAKLNVGDNKWQNVLLHLAVLGGLLSVLRKQLRPVLLLWVPLPFYIFAIAYGGVPIFLPVWTPYSYYNVRYGLQLLPAIAVFTGLMLEFVLRVNYSRRFNQVAIGVFASVAALSYVSVVRAGPICLREARVNATTRVAFEKALATQLKLLPRNTTLMMYTADYVGALENAGVPLRRVVNENNWGYWQSALSAPAKTADYVIAVEGDPVNEAVKKHPDDLQELMVIHSLGKPPVVIYQSRRAMWGKSPR